MLGTIIYYYYYFIIRQKTLEERRQAQKMYNDDLKDVSTWLISTERRFNQFQPVAKDLGTIKSQYDELKVCFKTVAKGVAKDRLYF